MKYIIPFMLLVLFSCNSKVNSNNKSKTIIKSCKVYTADFGLMDESLPGLLIQEFQFNKEGYVRELIRYDNDGLITGQFNIEGEDNPFPMFESPQYIDTVITNTEYGTMGDLRKREVNTYNQQGLLIEVRLYNSADSLKQKNTYEYNDKNFVSKDMYWDVELNVPIQVINYKYEYY